MRLRVVLPCRGEFGLILRYHVPAVHALKAGRLVVYHEAGAEALYPSATEHVVVPSPRDGDRRGLRPRCDAEFCEATAREARERWPGAHLVRTRPGMPEARFVPEPVRREGIEADVVLCPRGRGYGASKNWSGWATVAGILSARHRLFTAGAPDSSLDVPGVDSAWKRERFLDASIEAMRGARLVISTDAGLAHLAVLCGAPLLMVTYHGLVAPGPVLGPDGVTVMEDRYWPVRKREYYDRANHLGSPLWISHSWERPDMVAREALAILNGQGGK